MAKKYASEEAKQAAIEAAKTQGLQLLYIPHNNEGHMRVWRNDWPSDTFEIVDNNMFEAIKTVCTKFNIPLNEHEDRN